MALHFSGEQQQQEFTPVEPGRYDVELKSYWKEKRDGTPYINCEFKITELQKFSGRVIFDPIYKSKTTGEFVVKKINGILSAIPEARHDFDDYDDLIQYFCGQKLSVEIEIEPADPNVEGSKPKNVVKFLSYGPYQGVTEKVQAQVKQESSLPEDDNDLPF